MGVFILKNKPKEDRNTRSQGQREFGPVSLILEVKGPPGILDIEKQVSVGILKIS